MDPPIVFRLPLPLPLPFQDLSLEASEGADAVSTLPSTAPARGGRGRLMTKQASQSVKNLLDTVGTPDMRFVERTLSVDFTQDGTIP